MRLILLSVTALITFSVVPARAEDSAPQRSTQTFLQKYGGGTREPLDPEEKQHWFFEVLVRMETARDKIEKEARALEAAATGSTLRDPVSRTNGQERVTALLYKLNAFISDAFEAGMWVSGFSDKPGYSNIRSYHTLLQENTLTLAQRLDDLQARYFQVRRFAAEKTSPPRRR